jgi:bacteriophage N4 adsorption protein B
LLGTNFAHQLARWVSQTVFSPSLATAFNGKNKFQSFSRKKIFWIFLGVGMHWEQGLNGVNDLMLQLLVGLTFVYLISGLDDFFIDAVAWIKRLRPEKLNFKQMQDLMRMPEKNFAIIVPAWDEGEIIDRMLTGNIERLDYSNYHFFVGCYPNDVATCQQVQKVANRYPNVHAVINYKEGPSSKGQILNHVIKQILQFERKAGVHFDGFLMQDSEDLIHPKVLRLINHQLRDYSFVQVPVFSLEVNRNQLVAGTYVDEFAESHTKDMLVRSFLGAAVPSAGVGTAMSRELVLTVMAHQNGDLFNDKTVTEDYELGVRAHALGFEPHFASCYYVDPTTGEKDFIATREFFPKKFARSVRQKTRWTVGIAMQGWRSIGWRGGLMNRYFLTRDRKGPFANMASFLGYPCLLFTAAYAHFIDGHDLHALFATTEFRVLCGVNVFLMANRFAQRSICVSRVYGASAALPILIRWPLGCTINALASFHAVKNDLMANFRKASVVWVKTDHELPQYFGQAAKNLEVVG